MGEQTETKAELPVDEIGAQELLQGEALAADVAAKAQQAQASADRVKAVLETEHAAMEGIAPKLRGDYMYLRALLDHARTKI